MDVVFPHITVKLVGTDGNAFSVIGAVSRALRTNGVASDKVKQFQDEAMSGDYCKLLQTCRKYVNIR